MKIIVWDAKGDVNLSMLMFYFFIFLPFCFFCWPLLNEAYVFELGRWLLIVYFPSDSNGRTMLITLEMETMLAKSLTSDVCVCMR